MQPRKPNTTSGRRFADLAEHAHFPERLLIRHVAHAAGVEQDNVRLGLVRRAFVARASSECATCSESRSFIWQP